MTRFGWISLAVFVALIGLSVATGAANIFGYIGAPLIAYFTGTH